MQGRSKGMVGLGTLVLLAGVVVLVFGFLQFQKARASEGWPAATGTVISSEVETKRKATNQDGSRDVRYRYLPDVEYVYLVDNAEYESSTYSVHQVDRKTFAAAEADLVGYSEGQKIKVYYDPEDPGSSVLRPGASLFDNLIMFAIGAALVVGGIGSLVYRQKQ